MKNIYPLVLFAAMLTSCATTNNNFFRGDVIGFSDEVQTSYTTQTRGWLMNMKPQSPPYDLTKKDGENAMKTAIDKVDRGENTAAYYAMELAAKRVKYIRKKVAKKDPQTRYYIFLLTDGLDNASPEAAKHDKRVLFTRTHNQYKKRLHRKLRFAMGLFGKNKFEVYPILYEGDDIEKTKKTMSPEQYERMLADEMDCFRYSSEGKDKAPQLLHKDDYQVILNQLKETFNSSSFTFKVPKSYAGKEIRMNFVDERGKEVVMTAKLKKKLFSFVLKDIHFSNGCTIGNLRPVDLYPNDYANTYFVIEDFKLNEKAYYPIENKVKQEYKYENSWVLNSEYTSVTKAAIDTYFVIVMDGSRSLDGLNHDKDGFKEEQRMARNIIKILEESHH